jgi:hypothetical protein
MKFPRSSGGTWGFLSLLLLSVAVGWAAEKTKPGAAEKPPFAHEMMGVANGCFVESVAFLDHWQEAFGSESWAKMVQWGAKEEDELVAGHAVAVCQAKGKLWCWDINFGWKPLGIEPAQRESVDVVAGPILARYPKVTARFPLFRADFSQEPSATPPVGQPAAQNSSIRDASIVGERLAKRRPVNVLRYTRSDGSEGAAAIFTYHGRYCVYVPELGTTPFVRIRSGVENLRTAQLALNRLLPGVTGLKKL